MDEKTAIMKDAVRLVKELAPLLESMASETHSADDRSEFRQSVGGDDYFHFSNVVNALCSETVLKTYLDNKTKRAKTIKAPSNQTG